MSINEPLSRLEGDWAGTNTLHAVWLPDPIIKSPSTASVSADVNGQVLVIRYDWSYEGKKETGLLVLECAADSNAATAAWTDSWHSKDTLMMCTGTYDETGRVSVLGHYSVPDNPDWGWRSEIEPSSTGFTYKMFNISPEGEEEIAVETHFERAQ
jgi:hypothetical protein